MFRFRRMQPVLVSVLTVAVFFVGTTATEAGRKDPGLPGNHLVIERVDIDLAAGANGQLTITGQHFDFGNTLAVVLGSPPMDLTPAVSTSSTEIVVNLPPGPLTGDQLLTVSTGNGQSQNDEYDLTFGVVSGGDCPAGQVVQSIDANGQVTCVEDMHVKDTACPAGQVVTGYDANGVIQCALDQNTDTNVFNTACPAGQVVTGYDANGGVQCKVDTDTNVFNTSCPEGAFLTGYAANGDPQCTETGPPPTGDCPCSGITILGTTWGDDFETNTCTIGATTGSVVLLTTGGITEALQLDPQDDQSVDVKCRVNPQSTIPNFVSGPLSTTEVIACGNELVAIAEADGVTCE